METNNPRLTPWAVVQLLCRVWIFTTSWTAARQFGIKSGQIKAALQVKSSSELLDRWSNDSFLGMRLWKSSNPIPSPMMTARLGFQCFHWAGEGKVGLGQVKMSQSSLFSLTFGYFSGINFPQIVKDALLISIILKVVDWQFLPDFSFLLWRDSVEVLTLPFLLMSPI